MKKQFDIKKNVIIFFIEKILHIKIEQGDDVIKKCIKACLKIKEIKRIILYVVLGELIYGGLCIFLTLVIKKSH